MLDYETVEYRPNETARLVAYPGLQRDARRVSIRALAKPKERVLYLYVGHRFRFVSQLTITVIGNERCSLLIVFTRNR